MCNVQVLHLANSNFLPTLIDLLYWSAVISPLCGNKMAGALNCF